MSSQQQASASPRPRRGPWSVMLSAAQVAEAEGLLASTEPAALDATDPRTPHAAYLLADRGELEAAIAVATSLKGIPLAVGGAHGARSAQHLADIVTARLWLARVGGDQDPDARDAARAVLAELDRTPLDPRRLALVRLWLAEALHREPEVSEVQLSEARGYLTVARVQATLLGLVPLEVTSLAALALMHLPSGDLEAARRLSGAALSQGLLDHHRRPTGSPEHAPRDLPYWQFVATAVHQWAAYFQGDATDARALADVERSLPLYASDAVTWTVATTVVALAHSQSGAMPHARSLLNALVNDPRFEGLGVWRLFPLVADAYLAIASGDVRRVRAREEDLLRAGAPGEQLLVRAVRLAAAGDVTGALTTLHGVTGGQARSTGLTYPVACALEAMLFEQTGQPDRADASIQQALGTAEPLGARRIFAAHDPHVMMPILRRTAARRTADRWTGEVLAHLEREVARTDPPQRIQMPGPPDEPDASTAAAPSTSPSPLTEREGQVLALLATGAGSAQIGRELSVSMSTVKTHLRSIRHKLGAERTSQAVAIARSAGWLPPEAR
ncbi:LuxR C-terminal-related transcriptional regulator [Nocardioides sp. R1-1]|uniref:LuxR C-terminal-related transcriptional regulator n=1 Tax=Nocardioides sp. R1-1 TaxID=3383502 RepID=UPI0038D1685A